MKIFTFFEFDDAIMKSSLSKTKSDKVYFLMLRLALSETILLQFIILSNYSSVFWEPLKEILISSTFWIFENLRAQFSVFSSLNTSSTFSILKNLIFENVKLFDRSNWAFSFSLELWMIIDELFKEAEDNRSSPNVTELPCYII